jgi:hypothetical protein
VHLVADQVFHWIVSGYLPPWKPGTTSQNGTVIGAVAAAAVRFDRGGYDVFVEGIVGPWLVAHWLHDADPDAPIHYVILRPSRQEAHSRAMRRTGPDDVIDPAPIAAMFDAFQNLGAFEAHVVDSSGLDVEATVRTLKEGIREGRFLLPITHERQTADYEYDMARLAERYGIKAPSN